MKIDLNFQFISACCHIEKVFNLTEGVPFLHKYKDRKTGFVKAVKEMAATMGMMKEKKIRTSTMKTMDKIVQIYKSY